MESITKTIESACLGLIGSGAGRGWERRAPEKPASFLVIVECLQNMVTHDASMDLVLTFVTLSRGIRKMS